MSKPGIQMKESLNAQQNPTWENINNMLKYIIQFPGCEKGILRQHEAAFVSIISKNSINGMSFQ